MKWFAFLVTIILQTLTASASEFVWYNGTPVTVCLGRHSIVVDKAYEMFASDLESVTGNSPVLTESAGKAIISVAEKRNFTRDAFHIYIKGGKQIVVEGDARGCAYGLLELSRKAGVSPWIWWGDVLPKKKLRLALPSDFDEHQQPSVEYRGIFINDEDWSIRTWSNSVMDKRADKHVGINTYRELFRLLLRLRANTIWPAMHPGSGGYFQLEGAQALADSFAIHIGTSHCEPLLRNNVEEWDVPSMGRFNYVTNAERVKAYWVERLMATAKSKNIYTIGMRGIHDGSMEGVKGLDDQTKWLQRVIDDQRILLAKHVNKDVTKIPQVFVPYKEVLQIYENGLKVPDDVELMWCDDNYGYLTRLPDEAQQKRIGGGGIYYHLSYWGRPHSYLWLSTTQPGLIYYEMSEAWKHNVRREWICNVHDPKVARLGMEFFLDMAWDFDSFAPNTINERIISYLVRDFGQHGKSLTPIMNEYFRLCSLRKPEFMGFNQIELDKKLFVRGWSPVAPPDWDEIMCDSVLNCWNILASKTNEIADFIPLRLKDAFFATIQYPVLASAAMARKSIEHWRNYDKSMQAHQQIIELTERYNAMAGGKWHGLMNCKPADLLVFQRPELPNEKDSLLKRREGYFETTIPAWANDEKSASGVQMLGHSMNAVPLGKERSLTFTFCVPADGEYEVGAAMIPTQSSDRGDIRISLSVDGVGDDVFSLKEPYRSERWKQNVLHGQTIRKVVRQLNAGKHTLLIKALDNHIVIDEIKINSIK